MNNKFIKYGIFLVVLILTVGCDQSTKRIAKEQLAYAKPIEYLNGFFKLVYAENTGAFLGMGDSLPPTWKYILLIFFPTLVLFLFAAIYLKNSSSFAQLFGVSLIVAGGIGNLIDRIAYGSVVDFMNIGIGNLRSGIFNVADVAVSTGLIILIYSIYFLKKGNNSAI
jgi:signal peptidase II